MIAWTIQLITSKTGVNLRCALFVQSNISELIRFRVIQPRQSNYPLPLFPLFLSLSSSLSSDRALFFTTMTHFTAWRYFCLNYSFVMRGRPRGVTQKYNKAILSRDASHPAFRLKHRHLCDTVPLLRAISKSAYLNFIFYVVIGELSAIGLPPIICRSNSRFVCLRLREMQHICIRVVDLSVIIISQWRRRESDLAEILRILWNFVGNVSARATILRKSTQEISEFSLF